MALTPRESGKLISRLAKNVFIEEEGIHNLASVVSRRLIEKSNKTDSSVGLETDFSQYDFHPKAEDSKAVDWIFLLDTLNFSFWSANPTNEWRVNGQTGYFALCAAIKRAIDGNVRITDPKYYASLTKDQLENILRGDNGSDPVPMIDERLKNLHQVGRILVERYNGTFRNFVESCGGSAENLLNRVVDEFECFRDQADFHGHRVSFYKRAQILVGDVWACFRGTGIGKFEDIDRMTMFADYRIPQVLLHFGAMRYHDSLTSTLKSGSELSAGSSEEIEIRGCSIEIVERVVDEVRAEIERSRAALSCNAIQVDHFLWDYRRARVTQMDEFPFHRVRTIYY